MQQRVSEKTLAKPQKYQSIAALEKQRQERMDQSCLFNSSLSQYGREKVLGFICEKCLVKCIAKQNPTVMLLDTGAKVSITRFFFNKKTIFLPEPRFS